MNRSTLRHCDLPYFPTIDGYLHVGGQPLTALVNRMGGTPFYAYDRKLIDQRIKYLRKKLPAEVKLHYAVKANPMPELVNHLADQPGGNSRSEQPGTPVQSGLRKPPGDRSTAP